MKQTYFISGIDTDAGKTYVTAALARRFMDAGLSVVTQKFIQTGNTGLSEDIEAHRRFMGTGLLPEDLDGTTAPVIFTYPASAQLAARIDGREIDLAAIDRSTSILASRYDVVLVAGLLRPAVARTAASSTCDYIATGQCTLMHCDDGVLRSSLHL